LQPESPAAQEPVKKRAAGNQPAARNECVVRVDQNR